MNYAFTQTHWLYNAMIGFYREVWAEMIATCINREYLHWEVLYTYLGNFSTASIIVNLKFLEKQSLF